MQFRRGISFTWKMFATLFGFVLVVAHASKLSEIPSYIHPCSRKDSNYDQCIVENINDAKTRICTGMPEFNIGLNEPLVIDKIVIYDTNNLKLQARDAKIYEFCNFVVNSVKTDPDRLHFKLDGIFKEIRINTLYDFDIQLLVHLANTGRLFIKASDLGLKINFDLKEVTKNSKKEIYVSKVNTNLIVKKFVYEFDKSEKDMVQLHEAFSNVIESNTQEIIDSIRPVLEERISKLFISIVNDMSRSNYEKLFPE